jgi:hypothetical protein
LAVGFTTNGTGNWSVIAALPNDPTAVGRLVATQAAVGPTATGPLGLDLTNLLMLDIGK